ncbi:hypothetical protein EG68_12207 [Paragonimus skrjabini miyazakii]|uniref:Uncharacterized protein n=1 Tax=Paragonimus skrjabini miyazakii TaxID=59628 RepID=A0A8S9YD50_9TREM|nr:hypothetical protein EG68_12207 [Paragonimus skrjabini miyazakii]
MINLSNLAESFLTPGIPLGRMQDHLRTIEKWMHCGLQEENSRVIEECLRKILPVFFVHRNQQCSVYTAEECAVVASLLAAFMDSKCWSGSQIGVKEALWCELCLVENPIYLVDVLLQMTSKQGQNTFIHAVSKRVFSLSKTYFEHPSNIIRLIALHKWLKNKAQHSMLPSVQNLIENYISTKKLLAWMKERDSNFVDDVDPEQLIHELVDSYELTELVNLLGPPESTNETRSSHCKTHTANVISLIDKPVKIQVKNSTIKRGLKNSTARPVKSRREMPKPDGRFIFLRHNSDGIGMLDYKNQTNLPLAGSFEETSINNVEFTIPGKDFVSREDCTMDDVATQNCEAFKRMYQEYVDELEETELYSIPPSEIYDVKPQTSIAKKNFTDSCLSEPPPVTNDALLENSISETLTYKSPSNSLSDISYPECENVRNKSGVNSDGSLPTFKELLPNAPDPIESCCTGDAAADDRPTDMSEGSLLLSGTPIVQRKRSCSLRSGNKAVGKWKTASCGKRFSLRIRSKDVPGDFRPPLANDLCSIDLVVPGSGGSNEKNKTAVHGYVPDVPVSKTSLQVPYSLRPRTLTQ